MTRPSTTTLVALRPLWICAVALAVPWVVVGAVWLGLCVLAAPQLRPYHCPRTGLDLQEILWAYVGYEEANGKPPTNADELEEWASTNMADVVDTIKETKDGGKYVVNWGTRRVGRNHDFQTVLAYESKVADSGGAMILTNGDVKKVTAAEFAQLKQP